jgi:hypothetical protein
LSAPDVDQLLKDGKWRLKALTPKAADEFKHMLGVPIVGPIDDAEVFLYCTPDQYPGLYGKLKEAGLAIKGDDEPQPWEC